MEEPGSETVRPVARDERLPEKAEGGYEEEKRLVNYFF